ncbi:LUD domain-containing protein [Candidatus Shapirobacteria bacterium]|nr:LUD domain-containing protein [Candidatus Shapirobacteria bacterium]
MNQDLISNLKNNGFEVSVSVSSDDVIKKIHELIPEGSQVMTMSSTTLDQLGISQEINESGKYDAIKPKFYAGDAEARHLASLPDIAIGSVHAVTETGELVIASATGSQLPAYVFGAKKVIFVVSTKKISGDLTAALKRIYDVVLPLEDARALKAYGVHSGVNKLLILNKEPVASRTHILFVEQDLGF